MEMNVIILYLLFILIKNCSPAILSEVLYPFGSGTLLSGTSAVGAVTPACGIDGSSVTIAIVLRDGQLAVSGSTFGIWQANVGSGEVYYRSASSETKLLERAKEEVSRYVTTQSNFQPISLFIATWSNVTDGLEGGQEVNTFQLVLVCDSTTTYVLYIYDNIEWPIPQSSNVPVVFINLQSGSDSFLGSERSDILDGVRSSNVNVEGVWIFRADMTPTCDPACVDAICVNNNTCNSIGLITCQNNGTPILDASPLTCSCLFPFTGNVCQYIESTCYKTELDTKA